MRVVLLKPNKIFKMNLPEEVNGSYTLKDVDNNGEERTLLSIEEYNSSWLIRSNNETQIVSNNNFIASTILSLYQFYFLNIKGEEGYSILYCEPVCDETYQYYKANSNFSLQIGKSNNSQIIYNLNLIPDNFLTLTFDGNKWSFKNLDTKIPIYVDGKIVTEAHLKNGQILFIMGLKIIVFNSLILINNPNRLVTINTNLIETNFSLLSDFSKVENVQIKKEIFVRPPRFKTSIENLHIKIDSPPAKEKEEDMPYILVAGPMLTMSMMSMVSLYTAINQIVKNGSKVSDVMPELVMGGAMLATTLVWPMLSRIVEKRLRKRREKKRQVKYSKYLDSKKDIILNTINTQKQILIENNIDLNEIENMISNYSKKIWERQPNHDDFLKLRIGIGNSTPDINIDYTEESFELEEDNLKNKLYEVVNCSKTIEDVPVTISLTEKHISAVVGNKRLTSSFIKGLLLQAITYHGYDDLKLVIFTNEQEKDEFDEFKNCPHVWNNDKTIRFFATNQDDINSISTYLEYEFTNRANNDLDDEFLYKKFRPYYLIVIDDYKSIKNVKIIKDLMELNKNIGFSVIIRSERLNNLPKECSLFMSIDQKESGLFENELVSNKQKSFKADFIGEVNLEKCCSILSNVELDFTEKNGTIPNLVEFLSMYNVGKVEQLNVLNRWKTNNPINSLQFPIGVDENGEIFKLDFHEKYYGPHGLIAGMTGSGKSELIISLVLSMAVNYHPYEVSFVLIDYKGGGLAGAFENREKGIKLPHLAGTITNLDENEMNRSLASIQSELKRRQKIFNEAREALNESTIDIYKYQEFYREGKVKTPISHLFIICDEFAELKTQQPDFMEQLISAARIGRSLGVHLILATQKPSGVVDDQIWSNTKFRICLKVQEKQDSIDVIKSPEAASLKEVGRFYLSVGYNELFALGQSAWAGAKYYPSDIIEKHVDKSINFVNDLGQVVKTINDEEQVTHVQAQGEQLMNVLNYLISVSKKENIHINQLWLDAIPSLIFIDDLVKKYSYTVSDDINPVIGEYDNPNMQTQGLVTLSLLKGGNTAIYGMSGSGKENLLNTIIYSSISNYSSSQINFYLMDFGTEGLKKFNNAPQVGDFITISDDEKIENLFKMLTETIDERKDILENFGGDYLSYIGSGNSLPLITVVINNYDVFYESFEIYEDVMQKISRDGKKYGVIFILTCLSASSIKTKLLQNFNQKITLQLADKYDYQDVLGSNKKIYPSKIFGRGLVLIGEPFEFQTAFIDAKDKINNRIKEVIEQLNNSKMLKAKRIPVLPKQLSFEEIHSNDDSLLKFPVGMLKNNLETYYYNFTSKKINIITCEETDNISSFVNSLCFGISKLKIAGFAIIDCLGIVNSVKKYDSNFDEIIKSWINIVNQRNENSPLVQIIVGINELLNKLSDEVKEQFVSILESDTQDGVYYIIIDDSDSISKYKYENWYSNNVSSDDGIWIGNGVSNQNVINNESYDSSLQEEILNDFGYIIKKAKPQLIKLIDKGSDDFE